jgi:hypothetical protein
MNPGVGKPTANCNPNQSVAYMAFKRLSCMQRHNAELCYKNGFLGSGLVDHSQKMTVAARATVEKKTVGHRS